MAAPIRPNGVQTFGKEKWAFVPSIADPTDPLLAEVNHATALDVTGYLYAEGFEGFTAEPSRVSAPRRVLDTIQYQTLGLTTFSMGDLTYSYGPQSAGGSDDKKALETLTEGATGYMVRRFGLDADTDFAASQFVDIVPVELGPQVPVKTASDETGEAAIRQAVAVTGAIVTNVQIAAA